MTTPGCSAPKPRSGAPAQPSPAFAQGAGGESDDALGEATIIALSELRSRPDSHEWFQFKPGVKKLILSGTPDGRHVSVLWYGSEGAPGAVALHHHHQTESVFVIDGAQSDHKGRYGAGSFYFNPPHSAHRVTDSAGLFLLSYATPPDFTPADEGGAYESVVVGSSYDELPFSECSDRSLCHPLPLAPDGGMSSRFVKPRTERIVLRASVLLLLRGTCVIAGRALAADTLVVTRSTTPASYTVTSPSADCLLFQLAFA